MHGHTIQIGDDGWISHHISIPPIWSANNFKDGNEMRDAKDQVMSYLLQQFQMMLEDNFDEYCEQFENYLRFRKNEDFHAHKHDH